MNKRVSTLLASLSIAVAAFAGSGLKPAEAVVPIAIAGDNTPNFNILYSGGLAGTLNINIPSGFLRSKAGLGSNNNVRILFTPMNGVGAAGYNFVPATGGFDLVLNGGAFRIIDNVTGALLLGGQYSYAILHGTNGSSSESLTLMKDTVSYAATPFFPPALPRINGSFSIEFVSRAPVVAGPAGPGAFMANDGMTFGAL